MKIGTEMRQPLQTSVAGPAADVVTMFRNKFTGSITQRPVTLYSAGTPAVKGAIGKVAAGAVCQQQERQLSTGTPSLSGMPGQQDLSQVAHAVAHRGELAEVGLGWNK